MTEATLSLNSQGNDGFKLKRLPNWSVSRFYDAPRLRKNSSSQITKMSPNMRETLLSNFHTNNYKDSQSPPVVYSLTRCRRPQRKWVDAEWKSPLSNYLTMLWGRVERRMWANLSTSMKYAGRSGRAIRAERRTVDTRPLTDTHSFEETERGEDTWETRALLHLPRWPSTFFHRLKLRQHHSLGCGGWDGLCRRPIKADKTKTSWPADVPFTPMCGDDNARDFPVEDHHTWECSLAWSISLATFICNMSADEKKRELQVGRREQMLYYMERSAIEWSVLVCCCRGIRTFLKSHFLSFIRPVWIFPWRSCTGRNKWDDASGLMMGILCNHVALEEKGFSVHFFPLQRAGCFDSSANQIPSREGSGSARLGPRGV